MLRNHPNIIRNLADSIMLSLSFHRIKDDMLIKVIQTQVDMLKAEADLMEQSETYNKNRKKWHEMSDIEKNEWLEENGYKVRYPLNFEMIPTEHWELNI